MSIKKIVEWEGEAQACAHGVGGLFCELLDTSHTVGVGLELWCNSGDYGLWYMSF